MGSCGICYGLVDLQPFITSRLLCELGSCPCGWRSVVVNHCDRKKANSQITVCHGFKMPMCFTKGECPCGHKRRIDCTSLQWLPDFVLSVAIAAAVALKWWLRHDPPQWSSPALLLLLLQPICNSYCMQSHGISEENLCHLKIVHKIFQFHSPHLGGPVKMFR